MTNILSAIKKQKLIVVLGLILALTLIIIIVIQSQPKPEPEAIAEVSSTTTETTTTKETTTSAETTTTVSEQDTTIENTTNSTKVTTSTKATTVNTTTTKAPATTTQSTKTTETTKTTIDNTPKPGGESTAMRNITTMELVKEMGMGTNLGNTFEATGSWINSSSVTNYETGWGSPVVTKAMIKGYATEGFGVLRIPVAWSNMMGENYTINADYLARVKEVIDWALDEDLYVIMNIHWDGGWWVNFPTDKKNCMAKYTRIWEQLSEAFKDYSDYLMFESLNEEGGWEKVWNRYSGSTVGKDKSYGLLNEINQKFVDIVRSSGGNNAKRHLLIAGYTTDIELTTDPLFKMPNDAEKRCAVSIHYYTPATFCLIEEDVEWGKARTEWGNKEDIAQLDGYMKLMKKTFVDKGVPVIIGEYGVTTKNKTEETARNFIVTVAEHAFKYELCPVLWDVTDVFYDRTEHKMIDRKLMDGLLKAAGEKE